MTEPKKNFMTGKHWIIAIIIIVVGYKSYTGLRDMIESQRAREQWTTEDRDLLINKCFNEAGNTGLKYPELTKTYCECSNDKILKHFTKSEYSELMKKPAEEQIKISLPIIQDCLAEYKIAMEAAKK